MMAMMIDSETFRKAFENATLEEIKTFARITGHYDIHEFNINDLATINSEISDYTNIKHV